MGITNIIVKIIDKFTNDRNLIEEFTAVGAPKLIYNGADDKYQSIMASEFQFNLMVNDKTDGKFFHLYTGNEKRYLVTVEDQDNNLLFEGYLLPDFYSEPYDNGVIFVDLTATDGIGLLKGNYLPNEYYKQETSVIKLIAECLRFTQLDKNIVFAPAIESAATDYRWDEIAVNGATYLDGEIENVLLVGEIMPKRKNVYEILDLLLECLGCTLYAQGDTWYIEGINRKHEESQFVYNYDANGVYVSTETLTKNVLDLVFFKTPTVSIVSPWKTVEIDWDIDEDGELIPAKELEGVLVNDLIFPYYTISDFWKANGQISLSVYSRNFERKLKKLDNFGLVQTGEPEPVFRPYVLRSYAQPGNTNTNPPTYGEDEVNLPLNFVSIKKPKYLKISDDYIDRSFKFKMVLNGANPFGTFDTISDGEFSEMFRYDFLSNNTKIISSKFNTIQQFLERLKCKVTEENSTFSVEQQIGDWFTVTQKRVEATLDKEQVLLPHNGFFNIKMHAPISVDYTDPLFKGYTIAEMSLKYTEQRKWEDSLIRGIDFTTIKKTSIFHGDSIQDLSEKQFRFRRFVAPPDVLPGEITVLSTYQNSLGIINTWNFVISYADAQLILANPTLLQFNFELPIGPKTMNQIYNSTNSYGLLWGVQNTNGLWILSLVVPLSNPYFTNINDFDEPFVNVGTSGVVYGILPEDNEWRESWKRYGQTEDIRYGVALAKIYHDVQPEALVKLEGSAIGCLFPREIGRFLWRDLKKFIPARITIDFTKGRSEVLLLENLHEIVTDYVD